LRKLDASGALASRTGVSGRDGRLPREPRLSAIPSKLTCSVVEDARSRIQRVFHKTKQIRASKKNPNPKLTKKKSKEN